MTDLLSLQNEVLENIMCRVTKKTRLIFLRISFVSDTEKYLPCCQEQDYTNSDHN